MRRLLTSSIAAGIFVLATCSQAQYRRTGPAAGGGLSSHDEPVESVESYSSSELARMGCKDHEMRVGRDLYYNCNGMCLKREYVGGRVRYVRSSPPM